MKWLPEERHYIQVGSQSNSFSIYSLNLIPKVSVRTVTTISDIEKTWQLHRETRSWMSSNLENCMERNTEQSMEWCINSISYRLFFFLNLRWFLNFINSSSSSLFNVTSLPLLGLYVIWVVSTAFLSSAISSMMLNFLMNVLTPGLLWPTYWPCTFHLQLHRSPKYTILIPPFYMTSPSQPYFPIYLCSRFSNPHLLLTSSLVILTQLLMLKLYSGVQIQI